MRAGPYRLPGRVAVGPGVGAGTGVRARAATRAANEQIRWGPSSESRAKSPPGVLYSLDMILHAGAQLGPYQVVSLIAAGGIRLSGLEHVAQDDRFDLSHFAHHF